MSGKRILVPLSENKSECKVPCERSSRRHNAHTRQQCECHEYERIAERNRQGSQRIDNDAIFLHNSRKDRLWTRTSGDFDIFWQILSKKAWTFEIICLPLQRGTADAYHIALRRAVVFNGCASFGKRVKIALSVAHLLLGVGALKHK
jgi:hypothetical protein